VNTKKKAELKIGSGSTIYILMKRCGNCFEICAMHHVRCPQCRYMFIREAQTKEKEVTRKRLEALENYEKEKSEEQEK
tara:strand:- start:3034 stop:3267 length:234 start_codon:yes stop_codon:yes gene_type:complete